MGEKDEWHIGVMLPKRLWNTSTPVCLPGTIKRTYSTPRFEAQQRGQQSILPSLQ